MNLRRTLLATIIAGTITFGPACTGGGGGAKTCTGPERCAALEHCVAGTCVADAPPVATFEPPTAVQAFALVELDGSASFDPDAPDDQVAQHAWSFSAVDGACAPPQVAGTGALARVRFGCPGRFLARLVVSDQKGVPSAAAEHELEVLPYEGAPLVTTGPDVAVGHGCAGDPLVCGLAEPALLQAHAQSTLGPVTYLWSVEPPDGRELDGTRRVTLTPEGGPETAATISTDGTAISGDWIFRVVASDAAGPLGSAIQRVSVSNAPPVIAWSAVPAFPHRYDSSGAQFLSSGSAQFTVSDPEGDPLGAPQLILRHTGDGQGAFDGRLDGAVVRFEIAVVNTGPEAFGYLIGGEGLSRSLDMTIADVNGASASAAQPVVVGNRPPVAVTAIPVTRKVDHGFDGTAYSAAADLTTWSDPDQDPLFQDGNTGDALCPGFEVLSNGVTRVTCRKVFTGTPGLSGFAGTHDLTLRVRDPWTPATSVQAGTVAIDNRPPTASSTTASRAVACSTSTSEDFCCHYSGDRCVSFPTNLPGGTFSFQPQVADPDGDPLQLTLPAGLTASPLVCNGTCPSVSAVLADTLRCAVSSETDTWTFSASDGLVSASATYTLGRHCP